MSAAVPSTMLARHAGRFVALGGRLLVTPDARFMAKIDVDDLFEAVGSSSANAALYERRRREVRRFLTAARGRDGDLAALVRRRGKPLSNGWSIWAA